jgi:hypothetical protein
MQRSAAGLSPMIAASMCWLGDCGARSSRTPRCRALSVRAAARGLSAATQQPVTPANGMAEGACFTGGRTAFLLAGLHMAGKVSQRIGCGDPVAAPSTIPSPIGEARRAGGIIRSRSGWSNSLRPSADDETRQARNGALFSIRRSNIAAHSTAPEHNTQREAAHENRTGAGATTE